MSKKEQNQKPSQTNEELLKEIEVLKKAVQQLNAELNKARIIIGQHYLNQVKVG